MFAALPLAWKIGAPIAAAVALVGSYLAWQYHQQSIGREKERAEHYEQIMQQQQESIGHFIVGEARKLRTVERSGKQKDDVNAKLRQYSQAIIDLDRSRHEYEQKGDRLEPCVIKPRLRMDVDFLGRVLDDVSANRDPSSSGAAGELTGPPGPSASDAARAGDGRGSSEADTRADGAAGEPHH